MAFAGGWKSWAGVCKGKRRASSGARKKKTGTDEETFIVDKT